MKCHENTAASAPLGSNKLQHDNGQNGKINLKCLGIKLKTVLLGLSEEDLMSAVVMLGCQIWTSTDRTTLQSPGETDKSMRQLGSC